MSGTALRVSVSTGLLLEVAKLRALRLLQAKIAAAFLPAGAALPRVPVIAYSSERARARRHDLRTNLLRGTIEGIAAVLGGCDALCLEPYDPEPEQQDETARRLARHQHHLLRDEACLDRVTDPVAGAFALEKLTHEVAKGAWEMLGEIEARGGMERAMESGLRHRAFAGFGERAVGASAPPTRRARRHQPLRRSCAGGRASSRAHERGRRECSAAARGGCRRSRTRGARREPRGVGGSGCVRGGRRGDGAGDG